MGTSPWQQTEASGIPAASLPLPQRHGPDERPHTRNRGGPRRHHGSAVNGTLAHPTTEHRLSPSAICTAAPNRVWVADFTYCRSWAGSCYTAFVVDVFADRIVSWHVQTTKHTELVTIPLRMALWSRDREARAAA